MTSRSLFPLLIASALLAAAPMAASAQAKAAPAATATTQGSPSKLVLDNSHLTIADQKVWLMEKFNERTQE